MTSNLINHKKTIRGGLPGTMTWRMGIIVLLIALLTGLMILVNAGVASAEEPPSHSLPGVLHGTGAHFEITDSDYLNLSLDSSEEVSLMISSTPTILLLVFQPSDTTLSTEITLSGLEQNTNYWVYVDDESYGEGIISDFVGTYQFTQDLSTGHIMMILPEPSTVVIENTPTGGQCDSYGDWNDDTKVCTLEVDISDSVDLHAPATLDGGGKTIHQSPTQSLRILGTYNPAAVAVKNLIVEGTGPYGGSGIKFFGSKNATVTNVDVKNVIYGLQDIQIKDSVPSNNWLINSKINSIHGVVIDYAGGGGLHNNDISARNSPYSPYLMFGVAVTDSSDFQIYENNITDFGYGVHITSSSGYQVYNNNIINGTDNLGPHIWAQFSSGMYHRDDPVEEPIGGNYYYPYDYFPGDEIDVVCTDSPIDGFCDLPYEFYSGSDGLPFSMPGVGWGVPSEPVDITPPIITPQFLGTLGNNEWYIDDVTVNWLIEDPESAVTSTTGCATSSVTSDTSGQMFTCYATSAGGTGSHSVTIKRDATDPAAFASANPPPNNNNWNNSKVTVSFNGSDNLSGIASCAGDVELSADGAEQLASGTCTDLAGNVSSLATTAVIKIDTTPPVITVTLPSLYDVQPVGTAIDFDVDATISGLDKITTTLRVDGLPVVETSELGYMPEPGVYEVVVSAVDLAGNEASSEPHMLVIYDPSGGFATGGGWINSELDACQDEELCNNVEGKASFGFVSKYKKGASVPTGKTKFTFKAGGFSFNSDSYDWLVVNKGGTRAQFKGTGTINDQGEYKFMLWAVDGSEDTFRIKIWFEDGGEQVVYDNGVDQALGGGSIKVHK